MQVNTLNVEQFRGTVFFTFTPHKWGCRAKIKDPAKHREYLDRLAAEICAKKGQGAKPTTANVAADLEPMRNGATTDTSRAAATGTKRLLISPKLDALTEYLTSAKDKVLGMFGVAQQSRVLRGLYVLRNDLIEQVNGDIEAAAERLTENWIDEQGETRPGFLPDFLASYAEDIEKTRTAPLLEGGLGPLFDPDDYPTEAELRDKFSIDISWLALGIPEDLPPALKAQAAAKYEKQLAEAAEECKDALRASLGSFLDRLVERLTVAEGEKPKVFRDTLIENVRSFCEVFDARNFLNDTELAGLVAKCRALLTDPKLTPDNIRKYADVRENTRRAFEEIQTTLNAAIVTRKGRKFDFSE